MATALMIGIPKDAESDEGREGYEGEHESMDDELHEGVHICVPLENIKEDGIEPQEGDTVEFNVAGSVQKVEGGLAYIQPEEINGEPVKAGMQEQQGPEHEPNSEDEIDKQAQPMLAARDKAMGYG